MRKYAVVVVGATGNVGREVLKNLFEQDFPISSIAAVASSNSVGKQVSFGDDTIDVQAIDNFDFNGYDIAFFCTNSEVSKKYAEKASNQGCFVIDKSSFYRLDKKVPLVVPEVNSASLSIDESKIISNPNCCVIPLAVVLKPLDNAVKIKRTIVSTYQSVSGAGRDAMDELYNQTKAKYVFESLEPKIFPTQIAFNLFPHIGDFREDGYTEEEYKIQEELKKIIGEHVNPSVTCVRVPVFVSHSMSVNIEFSEEIEISEIEEILSEADGVLVNNKENIHKYTTPVDAVEDSEVFVSRIRKDYSNKNSINIWVCCDNLRKGAALNAVQIAQELTKKL